MKKFSIIIIVIIIIIINNDNNFDFFLFYLLNFSHFLSQKFIISTIMKNSTYLKQK